MLHAYHSFYSFFIVITQGEQIMQKLIITSIVLLMVAMSAMAQGRPSQVNVPVSNVYIPFGFDSNDSKELVVTGYLPNLCYQKTGYKLKRLNSNTFMVEVKSNYIQGACAEVAVSYAQTVELGTLPPGNYKILVKGRGNKNLTSYMQVARARKRTRDDFWYANVTEITHVFGSDLVRIKGVHPSDCYALDRVDLLSNKVNTFSVLPKIKRIKSSCQKKPTPFQYDVKVPNSLSPDQILIHVRTMNGNAKNLIYNRFSLM
jgi:hypothetical protein